MVPAEAALFTADDDGCMGAPSCDCSAGDGAPIEREGIGCDVFCRFRDADTVGLGAATSG